MQTVNWTDSLDIV